MRHFTIIDSDFLLFIEYNLIRPFYHEISIKFINDKAFRNIKVIF